MNKLLSIPKRTVGRFVREALLYPDIFWASAGRRVVFFPSSGRESSGLLRAYLIADHLSGQGWSPLVVPKHLNAAQRNRVLALFKPELVMLQLCRHPLNRLEYLQDYDLILDVDDADFVDNSLSDVMADVAGHARGVICGSRFIQTWALQHNPQSEVIWTGSPVSGGSRPPHAARKRVVTWAQSNPMAAEPEFAFVEDVILRAHQRTAPFVFRLYGWTRSENHPRLQALRAAGVTLELIKPLDYEGFLLSLRDVAVGLSAIVDKAFSQGKSFGKLLGYLDAKTAIICSDAADHSVFFSPQSGVVSNDPEVWVQELVNLLSDPERRQAMSDKAYDDYCARLSVEATSRKVADFLGRIIAP